MRMSIEQYKAHEAKKLAKKKLPKFGNKKKVVNGLEFDSIKEATRHADLVLWQKSGQITELERQRPFHIEVNGIYIGFYVSDFCYKRDGKLVIEDVKGGRATKTPLYEWKKKLVLAVHGVQITEI